MTYRIALLALIALALGCGQRGESLEDDPVVIEMRKRSREAPRPQIDSPSGYLAHSTILFLKDGPADIPLAWVDGIPYISATLDGREAMLCPDTGAYPGYLLLELRAAKRIQAYIPDFRWSDLRGTASSHLSNSLIPGFLQEIRIGNLWLFNGSPFFILRNYTDESGLTAIIARTLGKANLIGVLGAKFLFEFRTIWDLSANRLIFEDESNPWEVPANAMSLPCRWSDDQGALFFMLTVGETLIEAKLDTGTAFSIFPPTLFSKEEIGGAQIKRHQFLEDENAAEYRVVSLKNTRLGSLPLKLSEAGVMPEGMNRPPLLSLKAFGTGRLVLDPKAARAWFVP